MPESILVVDDETELVKTLAELLTENGYDVTTATDGFDALSKVIAGSYDLITMDLRMPKRDGMETIELIREKRNSTPIIVMSAFLAAPHQKLVIQRLRDEFGIRVFLEKPVQSEDLLETIAHALEEGKQRSD